MLPFSTFTFGIRLLENKPKPRPYIVLIFSTSNKPLNVEFYPFLFALEVFLITRAIQNIKRKKTFSIFSLPFALWTAAGKEKKIALLHN